jgi:hypothetical protein
MATTKKGSTAEHSKLVNDIVAYLWTLGWFAYKHHVGTARALHDPKVVIKYGIAGHSDIIAIAPPMGQSWFIECKTGNATLRENQRNFRDAIKKVGAIHVKAGSIDDVKQAIGQQYGKNV